MTTSDLDLLLDQMREAATLALGYVEGYDKEDFLADRRTQQAVMMNLIIIGETAARVIAEHSDYAEKTSHIKWRQMRNMRNRIAHGYFSIDYEIVWLTLQTSLPELVQSL